MRAQLADGRILEFPDGTDREVIRQTVKRVLAKDKGTSIADVADFATAGPRALLGLASGAAAAPVAGIAGLAAGGDAETVEKVSSALTYEPKGKYGEMASEVVQYPFKKLSEFARARGEQDLETGGTPGSATTVESAIQMLPMLFGVRGGKNVSRSTGSTVTSGDAVRTPPRVPEVRGEAPPTEPPPPSAVLPQVPRGTDARMAKNAPPDGSGASESERAQLRERLPQTGEADAGALPVRQPGGDASRRLQQAATGDVDMPGVQSRDFPIAAVEAKPKAKSKTRAKPPPEPDPFDAEQYGNLDDLPITRAPAPPRAVEASEPGRLPRELSGAKPRYNYGSKSFELEFESDVDRAAYISAQKKPSKRDKDYVKFVAQELGVSEAEVRAHGEEVRGHIKSLAKGAEPGKLTIARDWNEPKIQPEPPALELATHDTADLAAKEERAGNTEISDKARIDREAAAGGFTLQSDVKPVAVADAEGAAKTPDMFAGQPRGEKVGKGGKPGKPQTLVPAILEMGGVDKGALRDVTGETRTGKGVKGIPTKLFKDGGRGLDDLAIGLRERGFMIPEDSVDGGVQALKDMIRDEVEGVQRHRSGFDEQAEFDRIAKKRDAELKRQTDEDDAALRSFGPGALGANPMFDPTLVAHLASKGVRSAARGAQEAFTSVFGTPGEYRDLFNPLRDAEQHGVARIERWAAGIGHDIRKIFPKGKDREALTLAIVRGDLSALTPPQQAMAKGLQKAYEQMGNYALDAERIDGLRQNYSPQIWDMRDPKTRDLLDHWRKLRGDPELPSTGPIAEALRDVGIDPQNFTPFALSRSIKNVEEGMRLGLKPRSLDASELFETYAKSMGAAVERGKTLNALKELTTEDGVSIQIPREQAPRDYVKVQNPELEGFRFHPDVAPAIRVLLHTTDPGVIRNIIQTMAYTSKRALVSYSFFHPKALIEAYAGTGGNPLTVKGAIDTALKKYREGGLGDEIDIGLGQGLKIGAPLEDVLGRDRFKEVIDRASQVLDKVGAGKPLRMAKAADEHLQKLTWDYIHTGLKIETFLRKFEDMKLKNAEALSKGKITEKQIARQASEFTNATYGGLNWERMLDKFDSPLARTVMSEILSKGGRSAMQTMMFAPDWLVSTVASWTNALPTGEASAVKGQLARRYLAVSALYTFGLGNALNYAFTGHSMFENKGDLKQKLEVDIGNGQHVNIAKHFLEVPHAVTSPFQFALNKLNPVVSEPIEQVFNKDWLSTKYAPPITTKKDSNAKGAYKRLKHAAGKFTPITGRTLMDQGPAGLGGFFGYPVSGMTPEQKRKAKLEREK